MLIKGFLNAGEENKTMNEDFKHLFNPLKIGSITVPNRIFMSGAGARIYSGASEPNEISVSYYEARAKGGTGLIVTPFYPFRLSTSSSPTVIQSGKITPAFKKLVDAVHRHGSKVFMQLNHPGSIYPARGFGGGSIWAPSPVWRRGFFYPGNQEIPHEMNVDEIKEAVEGYATASKLAREAGYDGVEIAAMVGLLVAQFASSAYNIRDDEYGGSRENRMRFLLEIVDAIREAVGQDFVVGVRFTVDEFIERVWWTKDKGITFEEGLEIAKILEGTDKLDYLFPCQGGYGPTHVPPMYFPLASFVYIAAAVKEISKLPIFAMGRINDPVVAEKVLDDNQADMIGFLRPLVADPELPKKAREGRLEEIRRCIGCNEGCVGTFYPRPLPISCTINPEAGKEKDFFITPADKKKKVMVIGGGAAGLEAARVSALRGHKVILYEKEDILAKELTLAAEIPGREGFQDAIRYYTYQMQLLDVDVHLGITVSPELVIQQKPDAVVVATGAKPFIPKVDGSESAQVIEMRQVLKGEAEVGENVLIVDYQNHLYGIDIADFLAEKRKKVQLICESVYAGGMVDHHTLWVAYTRVLSKGVIMIPLTGLKEIRGKTAVTYNVLTDAEGLIENVDTIVFCTDGKADDSLYLSLKGTIKEVFEAGQCVSPRKMLDSVADGYRVATAL